MSITEFVSILGEIAIPLREEIVFQAILEAKWDVNGWIDDSPYISHFMKKTFDKLTIGRNNAQLGSKNHHRTIDLSIEEIPLFTSHLEQYDLFACSYALPEELTLIIDQIRSLSVDEFHSLDDDTVPKEYFSKINKITCLSTEEIEEIAYLPRLEEITIGWEHVMNVDDNWLKKLRKWVQLEPSRRLILSMDYCEPEEPFQLASLFDNLKDFEKLEELQGAYDLLYKIEYPFSNVDHLIFDLQIFKFDPNSTSSNIFIDFPRFINLENLEIIFPLHHDFDDELISEIHQTLYPQVKRLKKLLRLKISNLTKDSRLAPKSVHLPQHLRSLVIFSPIFKLPRGTFTIPPSVTDFACSAEKFTTDYSVYNFGNSRVQSLSIRTDFTSITMFNLPQSLVRADIPSKINLIEKNFSLSLNNKQGKKITIL